MDTAEVRHAVTELPAGNTVGQSRWQRMTLLGILVYESISALLGGLLLVATPDGRLMAMPVEIMHGVFPDFLIPGIILSGLGILNASAFLAVLRKSRSDWVIAGLALAGLAVWFIVEIAILRELVWEHLVWGFPVYAGGFAAMPLVPSRYTRMPNTMLICGILSSFLYLAMNIFVPVFWTEYNSTSQTVSELSAVGAPTRPLWVWLGILYTLLVSMFGLGVWKAGSKNQRLRLAGGLILLYGALGIVWPFAPMHLRATLAAGGGTFSDTLHIALGAMTEIIYLFALGFAAAALGRQFRFYSIVTFVILIVFGMLTFLDAPAIPRNEPTPLIGVWERVNIGVFLLWVVVLAIVVFRKENSFDKAFHNDTPSRNGTRGRAPCSSWKRLLGSIQVNDVR